MCGVTKDIGRVHDQRPVHEIERVGDQPDPHRQWIGQQASERVRWACPDQAGGTQTGDQRIHAWKGRGAVKKDDGPGDQAKTSNGEQQGHRAEARLPSLGKDDERADGEFIGAVDWKIERAGWIGPKLHLRADQRNGADAKDEQGQALTRQPMPDQDKGRPHQVKLFLYCQRPEMQDGARIDGLGEIIVAAAPEVEIRDGTERRDNVLTPGS